MMVIRLIVCLGSWALLIGTATAESVTDSSSPSTSLTALVQQYLSTDDADQAGRLVATILHDPRATVAAVEAGLRTDRPYELQPVGAQPQITLLVHGRGYQYSLFVPSSYSPSKSYALVVCLHGVGFTGEAYLERWQSRLGEEYVLACPTFPQGAWFTRAAEDLVLATIRAVRVRYRIDPDRIFLTGMSNGGIGAWIIGAHHAPMFAGIAPMAGGLDQVLFPFLENFRATPAYVIHGAKDQVMPVDFSRTITKELTRLGYAVVYREHDREHPMAGGHYFPREELPDLVAWFGKQRRDPLPKRLTVVRDATHLTSFGWVRIDATDRIAAFSENLVDKRDDLIRRREYGKLDVEIVAANRIEVRTERVRAYSLFLNETLVDLSRPLTVVTDGRTSFEGMVPQSVETLLRQARARQDPRQRFPAQLSITVDLK
ncbi:MAG: hypothetical protein ACT4OO_10915 [Nitrospiraceae bacterium]